MSAKNVQICLGQFSQPKRIPSPHPFEAVKITPSYMSHIYQKSFRINLIFAPPIFDSPVPYQKYFLC